MLRVIAFLVLIAAAAGGAAWIAEQPGAVVLSWRGWRAETSLGIFALGVAALVVAALFVWAVIAALARTPGRMRRARHERRHRRGRHAIEKGLLAVGHGDAAIARAHAEAARRHRPQDALTLLLQAQSAQLEGDRDRARNAFVAMTGRDDTRMLGMRGLFVEAQRANDPLAALAVAEEALRLAPASRWASQAVLGFRTARSDWSGALEILDGGLSSGLIDKKAYRRQRAVLLTARALACEDTDRDLSHDSALEAVRLAPTLTPAAVLASRYMRDAQQIRRAMKTLEAAWLSQPHPDLADAYMHLVADDTAPARLSRIAALAAKTPGDVEGTLAVARAAIDAGDFARARQTLAPLTETPTQRVAMLMAEIEHRDRAGSARSRAWMLRAVRAGRDPAWCADGCVSDRWRPVSPVTGQLDAFRWETPASDLPPFGNPALENTLLEASLLEPPDDSIDTETVPEPAAIEAPAASEATPPATVPPEPASPSPRAKKPAIAPVIPIVRAPDDPGVEDATEAAAPSDDDSASPGLAEAWRTPASRRSGPRR